MPYAGKLFYAVSREAGERRVKGDLPLVLLHGAGGSRLNWPAELRRLRPPGATVYALDLPGHERSAGQWRDTVEGYAEDVVAFLDAVEVGQAIIVGHSMGGAIALTLALDHAERVMALVLIATGARLSVAPAILETTRDDFEAAVDTITRYAWSPEAPSELIDLGRRQLRDAGPGALLSDLIACDHFDVMGRLHKIGCPTLVIAGTVDRLTPPKYAHYLAEHIDGARLTIVEGAGHIVMLERPAEVAQAIQKFLAIQKKRSLPQPGRDPIR